MNNKLNLIIVLVIILSGMTHFTGSVFGVDNYCKSDTDNLLRGMIIIMFKFKII